MTIRKFLRFAASLFLLAAIAISPLETIQAANASPSGEPLTKEILTAPTQDQNVYLPQVMQQINRHAYGWVTDLGVPAANQFMELRYWDGVVWSTLDSTWTDSSGFYRFNTPAVTGDQSFYIRWEDADNGSLTTRLWQWRTNTVRETTPARSGLCSFDLESVKFVSPSSGSRVTLPYTFYWQPRQIYTDQYTWNVWSLDTDSPTFFSPKLGYVNNYQLAARPSGFLTGVEYGWDVNAYSDCGYGWGYYYRTITFRAGSPGGLIVEEGPVLEGPALQRHIDEMEKRMEE